MVTLEWSKLLREALHRRSVTRSGIVLQSCSQNGRQFRSRVAWVGVIVLLICASGAGLNLGCFVGVRRGLLGASVVGVALSDSAIAPSWAEEADASKLQQMANMQLEMKKIEAAMQKQRQDSSAALWDMKRESISKSKPLSEALAGKKPVVVDFAASWCPMCLQNAPNMRSLKQTYADSVEFVTLDVSFLRPGLDQNKLPPDFNAVSNWWANQFKVNALPHTAFLEPGGRVLTAIVGQINLESDPMVLDANCAAVSSGQDLPYIMYDAFQSKGTKKEDKSWRRLVLPPVSS